MRVKQKCLDRNSVFLRNKFDLDSHPFRRHTEQSWDERSAIIDTRFHAEDVYFTPLVGHGLVMPEGIGRNQWWQPDTRIVPSQTNHNPIGWNQRMMDSLYFDTYTHRVYSRDRWGSKIQYDKRDEMVTRWGHDTPSFITQVLNAQLANDITAKVERVSRDGLIRHCRHYFMADGNRFALGTNDFSHLTADAASLFDIKHLEHIALRVASRSERLTASQKWGDYLQPVPGKNFRGSTLIMMTTGTVWGIWNEDTDRWMTDLRQLQDERIINGGVIQWRRFATLVDTGAGNLVLFNAGNITDQVAVTEPINFGDGAPDPDVTAVDDQWRMGQRHTGDADNPATQHYVQCTAFAPADFAVGDRVTIHVARTDEWGISDGVDFLDGKSIVMEVQAVDAVNERLTFREPITQEYVNGFSYTTLAGAGATGDAYAYITKAQDVHPVMAVGSRQSVQFVNRRQHDGSLIQFNRPVDSNVDFPSIERVTANWYGEINPWDLETVEIYFTAAPSANLGAPAY